MGVWGGHSGIANELVDRCLNLCLSEEVGVMIGAMRREGSSSSIEKFMMMMSLLSVQPYNYQVLGKTMESIWKPGKGVECRKIGDNIMLFSFNSKKDRDRVLSGSPWAFNKYLLMVQEYDGMARPSTLVFTHETF